MDHFEEVSQWLGSNSSTSKHANLSLISNVETPSFTSLIAEPVTEPFTLNTAEFLISNSPDEETKTSENRVLLNMRHESSGIKIESNWSSATSTSSQHLTVNTSEYINFKVFVDLDGRSYSLAPRKFLGLGIAERNPASNASIDKKGDFISNIF